MGGICGRRRRERSLATCLRLSPYGGGLSKAAHARNRRTRFAFDAPRALIYAGPHRSAARLGRHCRFKQEIVVANRVPEPGLAEQGIETSPELAGNLGIPALVEKPFCRGEGVLARDGRWVVEPRSEG